MSDYWTKFLIIAGIILLIIVWNWVVKLRKQMALNDLKNSYQHAGEPILLLQGGESDDEYWMRYKRERARYVEAGNPWALRQNPVVPFPFNSKFRVEWFDKVYYPSTVGLKFGTYLQSAESFYFELKRQWDKEIYGSFGDDVLMQKSKGQKEFDPETVWNTNQN